MTDVVSEGTKELFDLLGLIVGLAIVALLITRYQGTATVLSAGSQAFSNILGTATMQNPLGGGMNPSMMMPGGMYGGMIY